MTVYRMFGNTNILSVNGRKKHHFYGQCQDTELIILRTKFGISLLLANKEGNSPIKKLTIYPRKKHTIYFHGIHWFFLFSNLEAWTIQDRLQFQQSIHINGIANGPGSGHALLVPIKESSPFIKMSDYESSEMGKLINYHTLYFWIHTIGTIIQKSTSTFSHNNSNITK